MVVATAGISVLSFSINTAIDYAELAIVVIFAYINFWSRSPSVYRGGVAEGKPSVSRALSTFLPILVIIPPVLFFTMGLVQLAAIVAEVGAVIHTPVFISFLLGLLITYVPVVGSLVGFFGAKDVWLWPWWQAAILYLGWPVLVFAIFAIGAAVGSATQAMRMKTATNRPIEKAGPSPPPPPQETR